MYFTLIRHSEILYSVYFSVKFWEKYSSQYYLILIYVFYVHSYDVRDRFHDNFRKNHFPENDRFLALWKLSCYHFGILGNEFHLLNLIGLILLHNNTLLRFKIGNTLIFRAKLRPNPTYPVQRICRTIILLFVYTYNKLIGCYNLFSQVKYYTLCNITYMFSYMVYERLHTRSIL